MARYIIALISLLTFVRRMHASATSISMIQKRLRSTQPVCKKLSDRFDRRIDEVIMMTLMSLIDWLVDD